MATIRIGIDVGGTFTDAVAIDSESMEVTAQVKVPTTHDAENGVAAGIVEAASEVLAELDAGPDDVVFLAHGTTQATNALLEGDVVKVGIIGLGEGIKGRRGRTETDIDDIELGNDRKIPTVQKFVNLSNDDLESAVHQTLDRFEKEGVGAVVASQVFGVDDPSMEERVCEIARDRDFEAVGANVVSKRYGLRVRTRTAVINASILPRMVETSKLTSEGIQEMGVDSPLMIMRSDGGVMSIDEMQRRPIQTILSGPAAGVAGALMYENVTNGIFVEVGGTSSDISIIENGKPKWKPAEIGDHTTFLETIDIRTEGIAGGSLARVEDGELTDVGPRSAHIADLAYSVYAETNEIVDPELVWIRPKEDDAEYIAVETADGSRYALTPSGAANILGLVPSDAYAHGNPEAARKAFEPLAAELGTDVGGAAEEMLTVSTRKLQPIIEEIIEEYELNVDLLEVVGGGGGSTSLIPFLGEHLDYDTRIANNHETISTIGVGLAMVRDVIERTVMDPTEREIREIRREAIDSVVGMGANQDSVETNVEYDSSKNLLRAVAEGATSLQTRDLSETEIAADERVDVAAKSLDAEADSVDKIKETDGNLEVYQSTESSSKLFGLITNTTKNVSVIDQSGVVKITQTDAAVYETVGESVLPDAKEVIERESVFSGTSQKLPNVHLLYGNQTLDLSGLSDPDQMLSLLEVEMEDIPDDERIIIIAQ